MAVMYSSIHLSNKGDQRNPSAATSINSGMPGLPGASNVSIPMLPGAGSYARVSDPRDQQKKVQVEIPMEPTPNTVHIESNALMKIATHCFDKATHSQVNGFLVGMKRNFGLEITNAFPLPDATVDVPDNYQNSILQGYKEVGLDYIIVGFYQSVNCGNIYDSELFSSLCEYVVSFDSAAVILFDTEKSTKGRLSIRACRVKQEPLLLFKQENNFTARKVSEKNLTHEDLFQELEVFFKASPLIKSFFYDYMQEYITPRPSQYLELFNVSSLSNTLTSLIRDIDCLSAEYSSILQKQRRNYLCEKERKALISKRRDENEERKRTGRPPLPPYTTDDMDKLAERPAPANHYERLILAAQVNSHATEAKCFAESSINKQVIAELLNN